MAVEGRLALDSRHKCSMKVQLLPSSFDSDGGVSQRQHLTCVVVDDRVAFDAGSLALSCSDTQRRQIRDVVLSHCHLDHIAGLPLFLDDLFATLSKPVRVHASQAMIDILERDIFNWSIYPRFSELKNNDAAVMSYHSFQSGKSFTVSHLTVAPTEVNHNVPSCGFVISNGETSIGITGDTAETTSIWEEFDATADLTAVLVECAFPNEMQDLAVISHHLTPLGLSKELAKFTRRDVQIYVVNIKPMYRDAVIRQIADLSLPNVQVMDVGRVYEL